MGQKIEAIMPDSIAEEIGCEIGDEVLRINGEPIRDSIDYQYFVDGSDLLLEMKDHRSGEVIEIEIEKEEGEPLGFVFGSPLMSAQRTCANNCLFCFVDQMPTGLRESLYVKDDDWRTSFMYGTFVTLTNVGERELERIIDRGVSPLYISVQATEPALRAKLIGNKQAGNLMAQLTKLKQGGIRFHAQLVLCPQYNDGEALERSLRDLWSLYPSTISVACVPVGLTDYRSTLPDVKGYDKEQAERVIDCIERWQKKCMKEAGTHFVHASDEFYVLAERDTPPAYVYEGFPQIENGVGMVAKFEQEYQETKKQLQPQTAMGKQYTLATGVSAYPWLCKVAKETEQFTGATIQVLCIENEFFGKTVTVAGLIVGCDLEKQALPRAKGDALLIPRTMLREGEDVFLDHMTLQELQQKSAIPIRAIEADGEMFLRVIAGQEE